MAFAFCLCFAEALAAEPPVLLDDMDGSRPVMRLASPPPGVQLVAQGIESGDGQFGTAEHLSLAIPPGSSAPLAYNLPPATVIDELRLEAWIWCNRPGMQLAAVVVLPRSADESTGRPRELLVRSGEPAGGGNWEKLSLTELPMELERQARVARAQVGPGVDTRGAYVTQLILLTPGGQGATEVYIDKIAMSGPLRPGGRQQAPDASQAPVDLAAAWTAAGPTSSSAVPSTPRQDPPALPRVIQWQGEPFALLKQLGFDAIGMGRLPNERELAEATRLGLWLTCPPPAVEMLEAGGLTEQFDGVLAWDLGELANEADVAGAEELARILGRVDRRASRPTLLRSLSMPRQASRIADVTVLGRATIGASATWLEHAAWLTGQQRLARPGAPLWAAIDTQPSNQALAQVAALRGAPSTAGAASYLHLSQSTVASFGIWPRGFVFQSNSSLAATDVDARMRCLALELTNLRLGMVEPWLARGKTATAVRSSDPNLTAMMLTVERSHLVVPMRWGGVGVSAVQGGQGAYAPRSQGNSVTLVLPGAPESCDAYVLSVAGPRRVTTRRVTGGLSVTIENLPDDAFLLLTEDGFAFSQVERYLRQYAARAAQVRVELATLRRQQAMEAAARLSPAVMQGLGAGTELARVNDAMTAIHRTLRGQDYAAAFARAGEAEQILENLESRLFGAIWPGAIGSSPLPADWATLADLERVATVARGSNGRTLAMPGGEFENLEELLASGWRRSEHVPPGVAGAVRLSPADPHAGRYSLELEAELSGGGGAPPTFASPPVWITSPALNATQPCLVEISGWIRVREQPIGSPDPVMIFDSIGGEEAAVRVESAASWTPFRLVRAMPAGASCRVTIALGGVGRAEVDSMAYRWIPLPEGAVPMAGR
jgi:hypothetical protein